MKKHTVRSIQKMKEKAVKITMLTAYDYTFARLVDEAGIDIILVGDSLGMVIQGYETTHPVTMEHMRYHTAAVVRGVKRALVVADMPFLSYQVSTEKAVQNAGSLLRVGADAVKLEGGQEILDVVRRLVEIGIPVMGHLGLQPQKVRALGGYQKINYDDQRVNRLIEEARALEEAGIFSLVLENINADAARKVTESLQIPTIGIGSGPFCDGQVLVLQDMLGLSHFRPPFAKAFIDGKSLVYDAVKRYIQEVQEGTFPDK